MVVYNLNATVAEEFQRWDNERGLAAITSRQ